MPNSSPSAAKGSNRSKDNKPAGVPEPKQDTRQALKTEPTNGAGVSAAGRPGYEQIAQRAYEIYDREGRQPGREVENWLRAEAELTAGTGTSTSRH
jgi:hypothetical protein